MSFMEIDGLQDAHEPVVAPEGIYDLLIESSQIKEKDGKKNIFIVLTIEGDGGYANVLHNVSLPVKDDEDEKRKNKLLFMKRFLVQFGIPIEGNTINVENFVGSRARAKLKQEEYEGKNKNVIVLDQLPSER